MASEQSETKAQTLFDQGKLDFNNGEYESSVTKLGEACQLLQVFCLGKFFDRKINPYKQGRNQW